MKLEKFMLMLSFGLIIFSIVSIAAASAQTATPTVKITSPSKGQKLSDGTKTLTITGTSSDRPDIKCTVGVLINDIKPYKNVIPGVTGKGTEDFSTWKYTFTSSKSSVIKEGNNRVTSKISCLNAKGGNAPATQSVKFYSVNFTGESTSYKPITPSQGVNFADMKKSKNVTPLSTAASINKGVKEHKKIIESAENNTVNNGVAERKNSIAERKNIINNELNVSKQTSSTNEKGSVFVPPYNIKSTSGATNINNSFTRPNSGTNNQPITNATNIIPGKVVISNQNPAKPTSTSIPPKPANNNLAANMATSTPTNIIPGKVVIANQSSATPSSTPTTQPKPASIPSQPSITITINNSSNGTTTNIQNPTSLTSSNIPLNNNANNSSNSASTTTTTIINESHLQGNSIPGSLPNGLAPSLIFPIPFRELETTKLPSPPQSSLQINPSSLIGNLGAETSSSSSYSSPIVAIKQSTSVVNGQQQVTLNGNTSRSPSGSIVSYAWAPLNKAPSITSKGTNSPVLSFTVPNVQSDKHFAYKLTVTDNTGRTSSATVDVLAKKANPSDSSNSLTSSNQLSSSNSITDGKANSHVQVSNSNSNQNVNVSTAIEQSQNIPSKFLVNNNQVNIPSPNIANQFNSSIVNIPSNTPPSALDNTNLAATLSGGLSANSATNQPNTAARLAPPFTSATTASQSTSPKGNVGPVAVAGPDQIANGGSTVIVDGSGSYDPSGGQLSYKWDQISGPQGTTAGGSDTAGWSFKLPEVLDNSVIKLKLTVTNNNGVTSSDYLNIIDRAATNNSDKDHNSSGGDHHNHD